MMRYLGPFLRAPRLAASNWPPHFADRVSAAYMFAEMRLPAAPGASFKAARTVPKTAIPNIAICIADCRAAIAGCRVAGLRESKPRTDPSHTAQVRTCPAAADRQAWSADIWAL